jgi:hypothetical protein
MKNPLPGLPTIVALMLSAMIAVWLGIDGPVNFSAIQSWQTLIAALLAAIGVALTAYIAVRNVSKQLAMNRVSLRISLISREEDRIEEALPGLREAERLAIQYLHIVNEIHENLGKGIASHNSQLSEQTISASISRALPNADSKTRQDLGMTIHLVSGQARAAIIALHEMKQAEVNTPFVTRYIPDAAAAQEKALAGRQHIFADAVVAVRESMQMLERMALQYNKKINQLVDRAMIYRREIDRHLGEPD